MHLGRARGVLVFGGQFSWPCIRRAGRLSDDRRKGATRRRLNAVGRVVLHLACQIEENDATAELGPAPLTPAM
jgi:hypothetical protein